MNNSFSRAAWTLRLQSIIARKKNVETDKSGNSDHRINETHFSQ